MLEGIGVGIAAGLAAVVFRIALEQAEVLRQYVQNYLLQKPWVICFWLLVLAGLAGLVTLLLKWEPFISGSGIPQVEGELQDGFSQKWWRVLLGKDSRRSALHRRRALFGQRGALYPDWGDGGKGVSKLCRRRRTEEKMLMSCGASAGLAAAFNAPLAACCFP